MPKPDLESVRELERWHADYDKTREWADPNVAARYADVPATTEEFIRRLYQDFFFFCRMCLRVQDKMTHNLVPLEPKPVQIRIAKLLLEKWLNGQPIRVVILKARREGVSTIVQAFFFWVCATRVQRHALTIAHDDETTQYLFGMTETYYEHMPPELQPMRRQTRRGSVIELANPSRSKADRIQNPGLESTLRTVSIKNAGTGQAATVLHVSELGKWRGEVGQKAMTTALQIVPRAGQTAVIVESTAEGVGNLFHRSWIAAESGTSDYTPIFIPWFEEPTNVEPLIGEFERTDEEKELDRKYNLSDEQLQWRRTTIRNECGGNLEVFHQEYPSNPMEAFLSTGRPYFTMTAVERHYEEAQATKVWSRGFLRTREGHVWFDPSQRGHVRIWEGPQKGESYIIFADSSEGSEGDFQAAYVSPLSRLEIVAAWHGRVDRSAFGDELAKLGWLYNYALIGVEVSGGWGMTPISILSRVHRYKHIYKRTIEDRRLRKRTEKLGWDTTGTSRPLILDALNRALREDEITCNDPALLEECQTFVYNENGKPEAEQGNYDDRVIAASGLCYLWYNEPRHRHREQVQSPWKERSTVTGY